MGETGHKRGRPTQIVVDLKDLHAPWSTWCLSQGVTSSEAVRSAIRAVLEREETLQAGAPGVVVDGASKGQIRRVELRLTPAEYAAISIAAGREGMSLPRWLAGLVRVHVTGEPQLAQIEISVLSRSNQVLMALTQAIDKVARNEDARDDTDRLALAQIRYLSDLVHTHVKAVSDLTTANTQRWRR